MGALARPDGEEAEVESREENVGEEVLVAAVVVSLCKFLVKRSGQRAARGTDNGRDLTWVEPAAPREAESLNQQTKLRSRRRSSHSKENADHHQRL